MRPRVPPERRFPARWSIPSNLTPSLPVAVEVAVFFTGAAGMIFSDILGVVTFFTGAFLAVVFFGAVFCGATVAFWATVVVFFATVFFGATAVVFFGAVFFGAAFLAVLFFVVVFVFIISEILSKHIGKSKKTSFFLFYLFSFLL